MRRKCRSIQVRGNHLWPDGRANVNGIEKPAFEMQISYTVLSEQPVFFCLDHFVPNGCARSNHCDIMSFRIQISLKSSNRFCLAYSRRRLFSPLFLHLVTVEIS